MEAVTKAIEEAISHSYQYNLKIVGFPQKNEKETTEETTSLCLKILKKIGVDVTDTLTLLIEFQQESKMRRMVRETVLASRANSNRLTSNDFDLPSDSQINRIGILSRLLPKLQDLLWSASFVGQNLQQFCFGNLIIPESVG